MLLETELPSILCEYTPTAKETPPPYEFNPMESPLDTDNALQRVLADKGMALQLISALFKRLKLQLLITVWFDT